MKSTFTLKKISQDVTWGGSLSQYEIVLLRWYFFRRFDIEMKCGLPVVLTSNALEDFFLHQAERKQFHKQAYQKFCALCKYSVLPLPKVRVPSHHLSKLIGNVCSPHETQIFTYVCASLCGCILYIITWQNLKRCITTIDLAQQVLKQNQCSFQKQIRNLRVESQIGGRLNEIRQTIRKL